MGRQRERRFRGGDAKGRPGGAVRLGMACASCRGGGAGFWLLAAAEPVSPWRVGRAPP